MFDTCINAFDAASPITLMPEAAWGGCTRWLTCITVDPQAFGADREAIRLALEAADIESRPLWKPKPGIRRQGTGARDQGTAVRGYPSFLTPDI